MSNRQLLSERPGNATRTLDLPETVKPSRTGSAGLKHAEYWEDYPHVVARLGDCRVIESSDGIQWIIQTHYPNSKGPWRNKYFFRSKEGLLFYASKPTAPELLALPDWFPSNSNP